MKIVFYILYLVLFSICILSCEKDITVDLPKAEEKLVVEGTIDLNEYALVILTKNASYFDVLTTEAVNNSIIHDNQATVIVSNGNTFDTLQPTIIDKWPNYAYIGTKIKGEVNMDYSLKILYDDKEYFATTTIPDTIGIDSVWFEKMNGFDSLGFLGMTWTDPPQIGNNYLVTTKNHGEQKYFFRPYFGMHIMDDILFNGQKMSYTPIVKGFEHNDYYNDYYDPDIIDTPEEDSLYFVNAFFFKYGDTVSIKLSSVDANSYIFWSSWYRNYMTEG
ncbi:MAG TPA: hypothetical protein PLL66_08050, partial [Bacteroidales bacterium]|nr:hypothetical protein [Bacteroidales bacterium]